MRCSSFYQDHDSEYTFFMSKETLGYKNPFCGIVSEEVTNFNTTFCNNNILIYSIYTNRKKNVTTTKIVKDN